MNASAPHQRIRQRLVVTGSISGLVLPPRCFLEDGFEPPPRVNRPLTCIILHRWRRPRSLYSLPLLLRPLCSFRLCMDTAALPRPLPHIYLPLHGYRDNSPLLSQRSQTCISLLIDPYVPRTVHIGSDETISILNFMLPVATRANQMKKVVDSENDNSNSSKALAKLMRRGEGGRQPSAVSKGKGS